MGNKDVVASLEKVISLILAQLKDNGWTGTYTMVSGPINKTVIIVGFGRI
jgi:hypothetical protein